MDWPLSYPFSPRLFNANLTEARPLWEQMAVPGAGKRQILFGGRRVGVIHESPLPESDRLARF